MTLASGVHRLQAGSSKFCTQVLYGGGLPCPYQAHCAPFSCSPGFSFQPLPTRNLLSKRSALSRLPSRWSNSSCSRGSAIFLSPRHSSLTHVAGFPAFPSKSFITRSEEHTSELQSLTNLVCRLLLEKKKQ